MNVERESPFQKSLYTNDVLSDAECGRMRHFLTGPEAEAASLTQQINRLQSQLDELSAKRDSLHQFIDAHLALVSPFRRLPEDLVREIFVACLPSKENATLRASDAPMLLCHITRYWRNLALSTPRLWTSLHIFCPPAMVDSTMVQRINDTADAWLSRSGSLPLSLSLVQGPSFFPPTDNLLVDSHRSACTMLLQTLVKFAARWGSVRLRIADAFDLTPLTQVVPEDVQMLRSAAIDYWDNLDMPFLAAHGLTTLSLRVSELPAIASIHWESLLHLTLSMSNDGHDETSGSHDVLPVLRQCSRLETLNVDFDYFSMHAHQSPPAQQPPCDLPHLRRLSVLGSGWNLLRNIHTPELRYLSCVLDRVSHLDTTPNPLLRLLSSSTHLECLCLDMIAFTGAALMDLLRAIPTLRDLTLRGEPLTSHDQQLAPPQRDSTVVPMLTPIATHPEATSTICPRLERLKLLNYQALSDEDLLAFVLARTVDNSNLDSDSDSSPIARLSELAVQFNRWSQVDILPSLTQQIAHGLKIHLGYLPKPKFDEYSVAKENDSSYVWNPSDRMWEMQEDNGAWYGPE
ncbi:hypothetical protein FB45DRAFT_234518 [Roridomyces roridus]|uniref:F-box domain-containing protein n=1 Tax=Roridomyces roridus TaxID=1738132 RepID=A0AAD7BAQ2_9AGAR|nr:hypothetical protein FB45DRAFT_234518 [Roridomyces roridus]